MPGRAGPGMSLIVQVSNGVRRIGVLGTLDSPEACAELAGLLAADHAEASVQVDFYDADTLPVVVIDGLIRRLERGAPLRIVAYHGLLGHCLMRLGVPVHQVPAPAGGTEAAPVRALVLAGSAQSLDKIIYLIDRLPLGPVAVFVAQHVAEDHPNLLDKLLKARTPYEVLMPQHLVPVRPGTLYIAPPGHHMKVAHGLVYLTRDPKVQFARPSIDVLFTSLALEYGPGVLALLLCGFGEDGVAGCAALKAAGARVLVEDAEECGGARTLPDAAQAAGRFDLVLKLPALATLAAAAALGDEAEPEGELLEAFLDGLWCRYGYDFRGYQRDSLIRRIRFLMTRFGLPGFGAFQWAILSDATLFQRLIAEISVGVTAFFRHPEQFLQLRREVLPYLDSFPGVKIWSAGCATGEEPYSLAILVEELGMAGKTRLFATDLNRYFLELARSGLYPLAELEASREDYLNSGGQAAFDAHVVPGARAFRLREGLLEAPLFHQNSLVEEGVFNEFHLIVCRNVLIYFDLETQKQVLRRFMRSLHPDGFLMLGPQDSLTRLACSEGFAPEPGGHQLYRIQKGGRRA